MATNQLRQLPGQLQVRANVVIDLHEFDRCPADLDEGDQYARAGAVRLDDAYRRYWPSPASANASTSSKNSARTSATTCTAVLAGGRAVSTNSSRTARIAGRCATSVT